MGIVVRVNEPERIAVKPEEGRLLELVGDAAERITRGVDGESGFAVRPIWGPAFGSKTPSNAQ